MPEIKADFLEAIDREFSTIDDFIRFLSTSYIHEELKGEFNVIGSVNNLPKGKQGFLRELRRNFNVIDSTGDLYLLHDSVDEEPVYSYVYLDDDAPIFFTNANKTDQIPPTISRFLQKTPDVGRLMLSKREIDETRKEIVSNHDNVLVPYFSARRTKDSPISAKRRPDTKRSIQYRAIDGLETYREMRFNYGILPQIMVFEKPNHFKFKIKADGTFVHQKGSLEVLWNCLGQEIERVKDMKEYANTAQYGKTESSFFEGFSVSSPWAISIDDGIKSEHLETFESSLEDDFWEFSVSEYFAYPEWNSFEAEVIDESTAERTTMKTKGDEIRVFPRERTDIDQSLRLFNFMSDHFDSECTPRQVA